MITTLIPNIAALIALIAIVVLLWPTELSLIAIIRLILGIYLYTALAEPLYNLSNIKPKLRWLFAIGIGVAAPVVVYAMRSPIFPLDNLWFAAGFLLACIAFHWAVGRLRPRAIRIGRPELGFLGEYKIAGDIQAGGMGEVLPVIAPDGRLYAAKTFKIFKQTDSLLLGITDIADWTGFWGLLFMDKSPVIAIIRQCLESESSDGNIWEDAARPLDDPSKAYLLKRLNAVIEAENLLNRVPDSELDNNLRALKGRLQNLAKDDQDRQLLVRRFGRLLFESAFGSMIRPSVQRDTGVPEQFVEYFRQEAKNWLEFGEHPHVVRAHGVFKTNGRPYILLDYMSRGNLAKHLNKRLGESRARREDLPKLIRFALQICSGMSFAADRFSQLHPGTRFVHGDLKPSNCLLDATGNIKISDFGLSRIVGMDMANAESAGGTPRYKAPELHKKGQSLSVQTDVYAFGATLFHMLTGQPPVPASPLRSVDVAFIDTIVSDKLIGEAFKKVMTTCLAFKPEDRYPDFTAIAADLRPIYEHLAGEPFAIADANSDQRLAYLDLVNRGLSYLNVGLDQESVKCYRQALKIDPSDARAWNNLGEALYRLDDNDAALSSYESAIKHEPNLVGAWIGKGIILEHRGKLDRAEECYREALIRFPDRDETNVALINMGTLYGRRGEFEEAFKCFDQVLETAPRCAEAWGNKGMAFSSLHRIDEALECWNRALDINPMLADLWYTKGTVLRMQGKTAEALEALAKAHKLNPKDTAAKADYEAIKLAIDSGMNSQETSPSSMGIEADQHWYKALEFKRLGQTDKALEEHKKAVECNPQFVEAWYSIGCIYSEKKDYAKAINSYDKSIAAFDAHPHDPASLRENSRAFYNKGIAHQALGELDLALLSYDEAIRRHPKHAKAFGNRGMVLDRLGRKQEAAESLERAITLDPTAACGMSERKARAYIRILKQEQRAR